VSPFPSPFPTHPPLRSSPVEKKRERESSRGEEKKGRKNAADRSTTRPAGGGPRTQTERGKRNGKKERCFLLSFFLSLEESGKKRDPSKRERERESEAFKRGRKKKERKKVTAFLFLYFLSQKRKDFLFHTWPSTLFIFLSYFLPFPLLFFYCSPLLGKESARDKEENSVLFPSFYLLLSQKLPFQTFPYAFLFFFFFPFLSFTLSFFFKEKKERETGRKRKKDREEKKKRIRKKK